jgi:hypothetical protein
MNVTLEAIKFNHDPTSATTDAFNIRKNETQPVTVPEWRRGISVNPEDSPAAYSRDLITNNTLTIKAKFTCTDKTVTKIWVQALDGRLNPLRSGHGSRFSRFVLKLLRPFLRRALPVNVLGKVLMTEVPLNKGQSKFVLFKLKDVKISDAGVSVSDIIWHWQFSLDSHTWTDFATSNPTQHRIYTVLKMPTRPWQPDSSDSSNTQVPWTEVLDYACHWATAAIDVDEAATLVTRSVNDLGQGLVHYDNPHSGSTFFTNDSPDCFDCTDLLLLLSGRRNRQGSGVNCDDCAAIVATFANILGCDLYEGEMERDFPLNPHRLIGPSDRQTDSFSYHTVAWKGNCGEDDELFDACVQLDSDETPAESPHPLFVPANIRFGRRHECSYRFRLAKDQNQCRPVGESARRRRRVGFPKVNGARTSPNSIMGLMENRPVEPGDSTGDAVKVLVAKVLEAENELLPWTLLEYSLVADTDSLISAHSFWSNENLAEARLRVDIYVCLSVALAKEKLMKLVSRFHLPEIAQQKHPNFGNIAYAVPSNFVILFARLEFVFRLRNVGQQIVSCESFARLLDTFLMSQLATGDNEG